MPSGDLKPLIIAIVIFFAINTPVVLWMLFTML